MTLIENHEQICGRLTHNFHSKRTQNKSKQNGLVCLRGQTLPRAASKMIS
jgi:hypothetical protein